MSDPTTTPGSEGNPEPTSATPQAGTESSTESTAEAPAGDYLARIASGGEFATQEVTKHQSRASRAEREQKALSEWMGSLAQYKDNGITGSQITQHLQNYTKVMSNPEMAKLIDQYVQNGQVPGVGAKETATMEDEDLYLTDEQKEIRALREELKEIRSSQADSTSAQGTMALQNHLQKLQAEHNLPPEQFQQIQEGLMKQIQEWQHTGTDGVKAMRTLMSPQGYKTVEILMQNQLGFEGMMKLAEAKLLREDSVRAGLSTDGPSGNPTQGGEPPPIFKSGIEAVRAVRANPHLADNIRY